MRRSLIPKLASPPAEMAAEDRERLWFSDRTRAPRSRRVLRRRSSVGLAGAVAVAAAVVLFFMLIRDQGRFRARGRSSRAEKHRSRIRGVLPLGTLPREGGCSSPSGGRVEL